ncbi:hypothetical protein ASC64_06565 [Nocardioides sp. Root122]|nr:hypothetical protein ASC64_06565 [Nocardioides sp. Root122]
MTLFSIGDGSSARVAVLGADVAGMVPPADRSVHRSAQPFGDDTEHGPDDDRQRGPAGVESQSEEAERAPSLARAVAWSAAG